MVDVEIINVFRSTSNMEFYLIPVKVLKSTLASRWQYTTDNNYEIRTLIFL
jgi:hypothetical protein